MSVLRTLKKLVLGETWIVPLGIASTLAVTAIARSVWPGIGGLLLVAGTLVVLVWSVARTAARGR